ncbi:MAG: hypothetical protein HS117_25985 [Verrucomicrobiaceae bacterium]|nr:hypothetical protein [Verrucomicrobiaceae bacterium]
MHLFLIAPLQDGLLQGFNKTMIKQQVVAVVDLGESLYPVLAILSLWLLAVPFFIRSRRLKKMYSDPVACSRCGVSYMPLQSFSLDKSQLCNRCYEVENGVRGGSRIRVFILGIGVAVLSSFFAGGFVLMMVKLLPDWFGGKQTILGFNGKPVILCFTGVTALSIWAGTFTQIFSRVLASYRRQGNPPNLNYVLPEVPDELAHLYIIRPLPIDPFGSQAVYEIKVDENPATSIPAGTFARWSVSPGDRQLTLLFPPTPDRGTPEPKTVSVSLPSGKRIMLAIENGTFTPALVEGAALYLITRCEEVLITGEPYQAETKLA